MSCCTEGTIHQKHEEDYKEFYTKFKEEQSDQRSEYTAYGIQAVEISTLPLLTEDILPIWRELEKESHRRNKTCVICGKRRLNLIKYHRHMGMDHDINLDTNEPDIDAYEEARYEWINLH